MRRKVLIIIAAVVFLITGICFITIKGLAYFTDRNMEAIKGTIAVADVNSLISIETETIESESDIVKGYFASANNGTIPLKGETILTVSWEGSDEDAGLIYVYPTSVSDSFIVEDILNGGGGGFDYIIKDNQKIITFNEEIMPGHANPKDFMLAISGVSINSGKINLKVNSSFAQEGGNGFTASSGGAGQITVSLPGKNIEEAPTKQIESNKPNQEVNDVAPAKVPLPKVDIPPAQELAIEVPDDWDAYINGQE